MLFNVATMYVRFQQQGRRLQPSLMQARRIDGKPRSEHIASLGSVDADVSVRERLAFWAALPGRLARLGNRVSPDEHGKIYGALHARIPIVTPDEQRTVQEENAKDDERFWGGLRDMNAELIEGHKGTIALAEKKIAETTPEVEKAAANVKVAKGRLEKIERGESIEGGLFQKPIDGEAILREAGWTPRHFRRLRLQRSLSNAEFEIALANANVGDAADKAFDREARRIIRARR
jgi:hypothetical protein